MAEITLSKDAYKTLCLIYKEYLSRRKNNISKSSSSMFQSTNFETLFPDVNQEDFMSDLSELKKHNFVKLYIDGSFILNSEAVVYMENRFKNGLIEVVDFISKFIP